MKLLILLLVCGYLCHCDVNVKGYLEQFGYHNPNAFDGNDDISPAITEFQNTFGLPPTGKADEAVLKLMAKPRCGVSDKSTRNAFADTKWNKKTLTYFFNNYSPDLNSGDIRRLTYDAFKYWSNVTPLKFQEVRGSGDIRIHFGRSSHHDGGKQCYFPFDGQGRVLAHAFFPPDGRLHFDDDENYTQRSTSGTNYLSVATHEIGHILGLEHDTNEQGAIMYPYYRGYDGKGVTLHYNDIRRIRALYGSKTAPITPKPSPGPQGCRDSSADCYKYLDRCDNYSNDWTRYMKETCAKSCNKCNDSSGDCGDKNTDCPQFKNQCRSASSIDWAKYMKKYCRKTCRFC